MKQRPFFHRAVAWALLTALLLCLCGCAQQADSAQDDGDLITLINQGQNRLSTYNEDGLYFLSGEQKLSGAENIKYIDFATRKQMFLCADPGCAHDTDACTSYFPTVYGACYLFVAYDHLLLINYGGAEQQVVEMRDLDGTNAQTLLQMGDGEELSHTFFAVDRNHLYYLRNKAFELNGQTVYSQTLESIDIHTKEIRVIYENPGKDFCMGTCGRYFLLRTVDQDTSMMTEHAIDLNGDPVDSLHMPTPWAFDSRFLYYANDGIIYQMDFTDTCTITELNLLNGQQRVIAENYPAEHYWNSWFGAPLDNIMPTLDSQIRDDVYTDNYYYLLNLKTGEHVPASITRKENGTDKLIAPVAETGDYFVLLSELVDTGGQGDASVLTDTHARVYVLVTKEDYWNGKANYLPITDM